MFSMVRSNKITCLLIFLSKNRLTQQIDHLHDKSNQPFPNSHLFPDFPSMRWWILNFQIKFTKYNLIMTVLVQ